MARIGFGFDMVSRIYVKNLEALTKYNNIFVLSCSISGIKFSIMFFPGFHYPLPPIYLVLRQAVVLLTDALCIMVRFPPKSSR